jgi:hypothetical protein
MLLLSSLVVILGLVAFEVISSIDNAIINAEVLSTVSEKTRKWFLFWGLLFAVFLVRGLLPWLIIWFTMPSLGPIGALTATFSNNPSIKETIEKASPVLLTGGGVFLIFLFFHWLFLEPKNYGLFFELSITRYGIWFYAVASVLLAVIVWFGLKQGSMVAFSAILGSTAFFITHGFKQNAEARERDLVNAKMSDISKVIYLEIIDMTFSIDGVLGAFAFTLSVPLIIIGNGIGAFVVRQLTIGNIERIKRFKYLKNGAMYSIFFLGAVMLAEGFHLKIPSLVSPIITILIIVFFYWKCGGYYKGSKIIYLDVSNSGNEETTWFEKMIGLLMLYRQKLKINQKIAKI